MSEIAKFLELKKIILIAQIREIESLLMNFRNEISGIETEFRGKSQTLSELTDKIHNIHKNISVSEERAKSLDNNIIRFEDNINEYYFPARRS